MSVTKIYRCDVCGDESTKVDGWQTDVKVVAGIAWDTRYDFDMKEAYVCTDAMDVCPECQERIGKAFEKAWKKAKDKGES